MRALRFHGAGQLRLEQVPEPEATSDVVVIAVTACGVCGSDLHFLDGTATTGRVPITLGHEVAGTIRSPGDSGLSPGLPVVASVGDWCGSCRRCNEGRPNLCERVAVLGIHVDGGLADAIAVNPAAVIPIPRGLSPIAAATAVDAGATAFHAVTRTAGVSKGDIVLIIGIGGLGGYGVQLARTAGAGAVIAADVDGQALVRAKSLGADETILIESKGSLGRAVKLMTDGGVDIAIEFVGRAATVDAAVKSLRPGGRAVAVGVGSEPITTIPPVLWSNNEYTLSGSYGSLPGDAEAVLAGLASGALRPPPMSEVSLDEAAAVMLAMSRGEGGGARLMVIP